MQIRAAVPADMEAILAEDRWVSREILCQKIRDRQVYVVVDNDRFVGWLRYGLFWDNVPFMNMLRLTEEYRGKGIGKALVKHWEREMRALGYSVALTSTAQTECAQHFYGKLGYKAIGSFTLAEEPLELLFAKFL